MLKDNLPDDYSYSHITEDEASGLQVWISPTEENTLVFNTVAYFYNTSTASLIHELPVVSAYALRDYLNSVLEE